MRGDRRREEGGRQGKAEVTIEYAESLLGGGEGENGMRMLYLTPGLSHSGGSGKHGGGSHIGETPCDGSEGQ